MDIIDIMIAKAMTPEGQVDLYANKAQEAVNKANAAIAAIEALADTSTEIYAMAEAAAQALADTSAALLNVDDALSALTTAQADMISTVDTEIQNLTFETTQNGDTNYLTITYPGDSSSYTYILNKYYSTTGNNTDGAMTQKAVTDALSALDTRITNISNTTNNTNVNISIDAEPGTLLIVDENHNITASQFTENDLLNMSISSGTSLPDDVAGIRVDYTNHTVTALKTTTNFEQIRAFGGRRRCVVSGDSSATIRAWYGDNNFYEDGRNDGQVMVYQPKFYYARIPTESNNNAVLAETIMVSDTKYAGFRIHPIFVDANGNELDYILLSAYEGCAFDVSQNAYNTTDAQNVDVNADKLSSIANVKPMGGLTSANAEKIAKNRGTGWELTDLMFESAQQMLMSIEYNSLNLQAAFDKGASTLNAFMLGNNLANGGCLTGSTSSLGSTSGRASSSTQTVGNNTYTSSEEGKCCISYRGLENPYGNMWRIIGKASVTEVSGGGKFYYDTNKSIQIIMPLTNGWIGTFGYDGLNPWAFLPVSSTVSGNSTYPVGDYSFGNNDNQSIPTRNVWTSGMGTNDNACGPFTYAYNNISSYVTPCLNGRLMYKPVYESANYTAAISSWNTHTGGIYND